MELNRLVFPCPTPSYSHESMKGKIIYIPKNDTVQQHMQVKAIENFSTEHSLNNNNN